MSRVASKMGLFWQPATVCIWQINLSLFPSVFSSTIVLFQNRTFGDKRHNFMQVGFPKEQYQSSDGNSEHLAEPRENDTFVSKICCVFLVSF